MIWGTMVFETRPLSVALGAEVDLDLSVPLDPKTVEHLRRSVADRGVLVFRQQELTPERHIACSRQFGILEEHVFADALLSGHPEIYVLSNVVEGGRPQGRPYVGNYWHSDLSYMAEPSMGAMLYALEVPPVGGDTLFANMYQAFETLSPGMQRLLENLNAVHDFAHADKHIFSAREDGRGLRDEERPKVPAVEHPVVRRHPLTGRSALFVNRGFTSRLKDMTEEESQPLLDYLFQHSINPAFIYRHRWQQGDVLFWDNRCTIHNAIRDYGPDQRRHMHRTTIRGERPVSAS
jgi:taurine dioxygenase